MNKTQNKSVLEQLFEPLPETAANVGSYSPETQTWSHRNAVLLSPVKHCQEE